MQQGVWSVLSSVFNDVRPEYRLSETDRVDFYVPPGVVVECKIKGPALGVLRQLERYAEHDQVEALILYTSYWMRLPNEINGKPAIVVPAGLGWL